MSEKTWTWIIGVATTVSAGFIAWGVSTLNEANAYDDEVATKVTAEVAPVRLAAEENTKQIISIAELLAQDTLDDMIEDAEDLEDEKVENPDAWTERDQRRLDRLYRDIQRWEDKLDPGELDES